MAAMSQRSRTPGARLNSTRASTGHASTGHDSVNVVMAATVSAVLVAVIGIAVSLILTLGSWALAPHSDTVGPDETARLAVGLWLYAQHVPLQLGAFQLGVVPLGLMLIPALLCYGGGRQVARVARVSTLADVTRAVVPYALVYGLVAAITAGLVASEIVQPAARTAFFAGTLLALAAGGLGLLRATDLMTEALERVPVAIRDVVASATAGLASVILVSAMLTAVALAVAFPDAVATYRALDAGWSGGLVLVLLTVAFVPNLVLWTASYTTGVGFTLGVEGTVSPQGVDYGALPVFPPLAALPPEGDGGGWAFIALLAPILGGYVIATVMHRRQHGLSVEQLAGRAAVAGALAGLAVGVLAWLSAGSAGEQSLASLGPVGWKVGLVAALEMSLIAAVVAWERHRRGGLPRPHLRKPQLIDLRDRLNDRVKGALKVR